MYFPVRCNTNSIFVPAHYLGFITSVLVQKDNAIKLNQMKLKDSKLNGLKKFISGDRG